MAEIDVIEIETPRVPEVVEVVVNQGVKGDTGSIDQSLVDALNELNNAVDYSLLYANAKV